MDTAELFIYTIHSWNVDAQLKKRLFRQASG